MAVGATYHFKMVDDGTAGRKNRKILRFIGRGEVRGKEISGASPDDIGDPTTSTASGECLVGCDVGTMLVLLAVQRVGESVEYGPKDAVTGVTGYVRAWRIRLPLAAVGRAGAG